MNGFGMLLIVMYNHVDLMLMQGLSEWLWPTYGVHEKEAITIETPSHFGMAVGGKFDLVDTQLGSDGYFLNFVLISSLTHLVIQKSSGDESLSVLIPGEKPLTRQTCLDQQKEKLITWFSAVEVLAWEWVNATYPKARPDTIFLVTGQTLTDEYDITHQEKAHSRCEVLLERDPNIESPEIEVLGYKFHTATGFFGFETRRRKSPTDTGKSRLYSVFLEIHESKPIKRIRFEPALRARLEDMFKLPLSLFFNKRFFVKKAEIPSQERRESSVYSDDGGEPHDAALNDFIPERVAMQSGARCDWHLLKIGDDDYAVQYSGPDAEKKFPNRLTGTAFL